MGLARLSLCILIMSRCDQFPEPPGPSGHCAGPCSSTPRDGCVQSLMMGMNGGAGGAGVAGKSRPKTQCVQRARGSTGQEITRRLLSRRPASPWDIASRRSAPSPLFLPVTRPQHGAQWKEGIRQAAPASRPLMALRQHSVSYPPVCVLCSCPALGALCIWGAGGAHPCLLLGDGHLTCPPWGPLSPQVLQGVGRRGLMCLTAQICSHPHLVPPQFW